MKDVCKKILFLSSFQRKLKHCPLIEVNQFIGFEDQSNFELEKDLIYSGTFREGSILEGMCGPIDKIEKNVFPYIRDLSFNGYCLAGGAPSWAVHSGFLYTDMDLDFFPVVGECTGNNWKIEKLEKAKKIYNDFSLEMKNLKEKLGEHFSLLIWQNENCTTFSFYHDYRKMYKDKNAKCDRCQNKINCPFFKLSFIHRAYNTPDQILQGFDLPAAQVLYDGFQFKMSYAALLSLHYSIIPVDVSSASDSFYRRLYKYNYNKNFRLVFCGLDIEKFHYQKSIIKSVSNKPSFRIKFPKGAFIWQSFTEKESVHFSLGYANNKDPKINPDSMTKESDYGYIEQYIVGSTYKLNVYGLKHFLLTGKVLKRKWSCNEKFKAADIEKALREICSFKMGTDTFLIGQLFPKIFNEDANNAIVAFACRDLEKFNSLYAKHVPHLLEKYRVESLKEDITFLVDEPGTQTRRSFNPVDLTARGFYGSYYNGFHCTMDWEAKCQIIIAYRKERTGKNDQCCLFWLDMNLIKYIFHWLDRIWMKTLIEDAENILV